MKILPEFKELIPPLGDDEYKKLEESCIKEGIRDKILLWNEYIIDGHHRYKISKEHNLKFKTLNKSFDNKNDVKIWMILNQLSRRNISDFVKGELIEIIEKFLKEKGEQNLKTNIGNNQRLSIVDKGKDHNTRKIIADKLGWSTGKKAMFDVVRKKAPEETKEKLRTGEVSINAAYNEIKKIEWRDNNNLDKLKNHNIINEVTNLRIIKNDPNMFYVSGERSLKRFGDTIFSLKDDVYYTVTTLSRFFHKETGLEFSLREYADVQMFPKDFKFIGSYTDIKKQIGNAVSPFMGQYISKNLKGKTAGDLFAGCGGFTCGLHKNNIISKWAIEWEDAPTQTYKLNFENAKVIRANIRKINPLDFEKVDIIVGGPPCQGLSNAGSDTRSNELRFIEDPRNELYKEFIRFLNVLKPKEFIMENVKEIEQFKDQIKKDFESVGYEVDTFLINGNDIGMKQSRKRFFFIGKLK